MTDIIKSKIQELNKESLDVISTEAMSNPLKGMTEIIKARLHKIVNSLSNNKNAEVMEGHDMRSDAITDFMISHKENKGKYAKQNTYLGLKDINVVVPVGFTGDLIGYATTLNQASKTMAQLSKDVLEPTHNLILKYIGKPETMSNISNSDFSKIKLHSSEIEKFKKEMNLYFSTKQKHQALPVGKLIKNLNQFSDLANLVSTSIVPFELDVKSRDRIYKSYTQLQQSLDLLLVRIEQKPDQYQLTKLNAERLANLINDVAVELELYSALVNYNHQLIVCTVALKNRLLEKLD